MNLEDLDPEEEESNEEDVDSGGAGGGSNPIGDRGLPIDDSKPR